jgi:hypothetical protein
MEFKGKLRKTDVFVEKVEAKRFHPCGNCEHADWDWEEKDSFGCPMNVSPICIRNEHCIGWDNL